MTSATTCAHCGLDIDPVFGRCRDADCPRALIGHDKTRELLEDFVAWLNTRGVRLCSRSNLKLDRNRISKAINDYVGDRVRQPR